MGTRGGLLRQREFRRLWIGDSLSQVGTQVSVLALPLLALTTLQASTFEVGLLTTLEMMPFLVIGLPAGAWVDRMRHRQVLIVTDLVRVVALGSLAVAAAAGALTLAQLYVVAVVTGTGTVFFMVAYPSYLPELVAPEDLVEGNAKLQSSQAVAEFAGPPLGGLLVQAFTAPYAVAVDAATYLWSALWLRTITIRPPRPARRPGSSMRRDIGEGLSYVLRHSTLRAITTATSIANFTDSAVGVLLVVLLARDLHLSPGLIGLTTSASAVGGFAGAATARRVGGRLGQGPALCVAIAVAMPAQLVVPFVHRDWTFAVLLLLRAVNGYFVVVYNVLQVSFRQGLCPAPLRGRMNATVRFLAYGAVSLGGVAAGSLGAWLGVRPALGVTASIGIVALLPVVAGGLLRMPTLAGEAEVGDPVATGRG